MSKKRLSIFLGFFLFYILLVLTRFFYWQILVGGHLASIAQKQRFLTTEIPAPRGGIFTNDGYPIVSNKTTFLLYAYLPELEESKEMIIKQLSPLLVSDRNETATDSSLKKALEEEEVERLKSKFSSGKKWIVLERKISKETQSQIDSLAFKGLDFEKEEIRNYPEASMAAQLLGFVGYDQNSSSQGYFGLEGYYDQQLSGLPGLILSEKEVSGKPILFGKSVKERMSPGFDLTTFVDRSIQLALEEELKKGIEKYGAKSGWAVIIDSNTSGVLGMASFPNYDPGTYFNYSQELFPNPVVAEGFEPGSIFKPIVTAMAIEKGVVTPETVCTFCGGPRRIGDYEIKTWNEKYFPNSTVTEIIQHSDNVGMVFISDQLGKENIFAMINDFGLNRKTGIDLQEEIAPAVKRKDDWYPIDVATVSFGQGISVTPIQMIQAFNSLANNGKLTSPKIVKQIGKKRDDYQYTPNKEERILSAKTVNEIVAILVNAVEKGEIKWDKPKGLSVAGKTGTAQIPIGGHYDQEKTIASFIGFFPAENPKYTMLVSLREPTVSPWGSETAAPVWFRILKRLVYLKGLK